MIKSATPVREVGQSAKVLAADDLTPGTHMVEGENHSYKVPLTPVNAMDATPLVPFRSTAIILMSHWGTSLAKLSLFSVGEGFCWPAGLELTHKPLILCFLPAVLFLQILKFLSDLFTHKTVI